MLLQKHESYRYEHWKNWVGCVSTRWQKMLLYETCTFWKKGYESLKRWHFYTLWLPSTFFFLK